MRTCLVLSCALAVALAPPAGCVGSEQDSWVAAGSGGMVVSDSPLASEAGIEVLRDGGNAVDAAIAVSLVLSTVRPYGSGLGGGGFALIRIGRTGQTVALDYRETAPAASTPDMFVKARERSPAEAPPSRYGGLAIATPGLVAGHAEMLAKYGTRPLHDLVRPAVRLAREGFATDESFAGTARQTKKLLDKHPSLRAYAGYVRATFLAGDEDPAAGRRILQPALADALERIGRQGAEGFYDGPIAADIAAAAQRAGGVLGYEDLRRYRPVWREPLRVRYRRFELLLMPPPSSGGVAIGESLNFLEAMDMAALWREDEAAAIHWLIEAMKHAFADRARWLGDPDAVHVPVSRLLDKEYARTLVARSRADRTSGPEAYGAVALPDDSGTTHFSVADRWGNLVACTETINTAFGSLVVAERFGIVLNNEMDDFTADPGKPNAFGLIQSDRNAPRPGRRPLSSMSPTIVLEDGRPRLVLGASGGPRIITSVLNVLVGVMDRGLALPDAMRSARFHHQWQPDEVVVSREVSPAVAEGLARRGHRIAAAHGSGHVEAIAIEDGRYVGTSDPAKGGRPCGLP